MPNIASTPAVPKICSVPGLVCNAEEVANSLYGCISVDDVRDSVEVELPTQDEPCIEEVTFDSSLEKLKSRVMLFANKEHNMCKGCVPYVSIDGLGVVPIINPNVEKYVTTMYDKPLRTVPVCIYYPRQVVALCKRYNIGGMRPEDAFNILVAADMMTDVILSVKSKVDGANVNLDLIKSVLGSACRIYDTLIERNTKLDFKDIELTIWESIFDEYERSRL